MARKHIFKGLVPISGRFFAVKRPMASGKMGGFFKGLKLSASAPKAVRKSKGFFKGLKLK